MSAFIRPIVTIFSIVLILWAASSLLRLKTTEIHMNATAVVQGLAMGQMFKVESMRFYNDYGRWPGSNRELNLKDGADYAKKAIKRVDIGEDGVITFTYNSKSGVDNGTVKWLPPVGGGSQWGCVTSSFPGIAQYIPQCRFEKPVALQE